MSMLDRKVKRDLRRMWSQALTIALIVASGVACLTATLSAVSSLESARAGFYAQGRFADLFAVVRRAPLSLLEPMRAIPGVFDVQVTLEQTVRMELPDTLEPVIGHLIGIDPRHAGRLNLVTVVAGRAPEPRAALSGSGPIPALVSRAFAQARGLRPGSTLRALINGRLRTLAIAGIALSPEFIFAGLWGMPDARGYGIFWVPREALEGAYNMEGAFTHAAVRLAPGASEPAAASALLQLLSPWGGREVYGRERQVSHAMLANEIAQQRLMGTLLPAIFFAVAAFLLHVVVARMVATQREQIATLKALGFPNVAIGAHYLKIVSVIVAIGWVLGALAGKQLGFMLMGLYGESFHFPEMPHRVGPVLLVGGAALTFATAVAGTLQAVGATVRLPPAAAMRPAAPTRFSATLLERLWGRLMSPQLRMIFRNMERRPVRTLVAVAGIATALSIVILGNFFHGAMDRMIDTQFTLGLRGDITVWTLDPVDDAMRLDLQRLPGVVQVEPLRFVTVNLRAGHRQERTILRGYAGRPLLYRVIDVAEHEIVLEGRGLVMTDRLAAKLGLRPGDTAQVELLEGRIRTLPLLLTATVDEVFGLNAYMDRTALNRLLADGDLSTGFVLHVQPGMADAALAALRRAPRIAGAWSKSTMLANMQEITARNIRIISTIMTTFAAIIAVGVVYNVARIALSERAWEFASLRVLGFTRAEVSTLLLGELAIVTAVAIPVGMLFGYSLVSLVAEAIKSDQFHFPVVIDAASYAGAVLCVLVSGIATGLVVRRSIDRLDLVAVLKTRE